MLLPDQGRDWKRGEEMYYCPKCAAQNAEDAKFCRSCGANISLVSQALSGELLEDRNRQANLLEDAFGSFGATKNGRGKAKKASVVKPVSGVNMAPMNLDWSGGGKRKKQPSLESGITNIFMGVGFVFVAFAALFFAPAGRIWWFWLLIPAFAMFGGGVAELVRLKLGRQLAPVGNPTTAVPPIQRAAEIPAARTTTEIPQPPSVTEGTTRHLDTESSKRYFDALDRPADKI